MYPHLKEMQKVFGSAIFLGMYNFVEFPVDEINTEYAKTPGILGTLGRIQCENVNFMHQAISAK